jgi:hypothetical protein
MATKSPKSGVVESLNGLSVIDFRALKQE